jgi:uncharacterized membrane protein YfcA
LLIASLLVSAAAVAPLLAFLAAGGLVTGFLAGLFGIGGGGILVPVLYEAFGAVGVDPALRMHMAIGTSLAIIVPTSARSFLSHRARGAVDMSVIRRLALPVVAGVLIGVLVAQASPSAVLKWIWIVFALVLAGKLFFGKEHWRLGSEIPTSRLVEAYGIAVGFVSTLMSIGGGAFIATLMTLYDRPLRQGIGTSSGFGPIIAVPGVLGFIWAGWPLMDTAVAAGGLPVGSLGYVNLVAIALVAPLSVMMAPLGARMAHGISKRSLEIAFGCFLLAVAARFLFALAT